MDFPLSSDIVLTIAVKFKTFVTLVVIIRASLYASTLLDFASSPKLVTTVLRFMFIADALLLAFRARVPSITKVFLADHFHRMYSKKSLERFRREC